MNHEIFNRKVMNRFEVYAIGQNEFLMTAFEMRQCKRTVLKHLGSAIMAIQDFDVRKMTKAPGN